MIVSELIGLLEQYDGDAEVRLALQPTYPFEHSILGVVCQDELRDAIEGEWSADEQPTHDVVWIAEKEQIGMVTHQLWAAVNR